MTLTEMGKLLTVAATIDNRSINEFTVQAWFEVIGNLDFDEAREALYDHYADSTAWLMPAHIHERIEARRERERRQRDLEHQRRMREEQAAVRQIEGGPGMPIPGRYGHRHIRDDDPPENCAECAPKAREWDRFKDVRGQSSPVLASAAINETLARLRAAQQPSEESAS